jgi:TRAP-type uncharacterized transport system fused permease subunit
LTACKLAIVAYIVPFAFMYNPALMAIGTVPKIVLSVATAIVGVLSLSSGISGFLFVKLKPWQRIIMAAAGVGLLWHFVWVNAIGLAVFVLMIVLQKLREKQPAEPGGSYAT